VKEDLSASVRTGGTSKDEREAHEDERRSIEQDAKQARDEAVIDALTPQGVKDFQARQEVDREEQAARYAAEQHADRAARAGQSSATFSGYLTGTVEGLAVDVTADAEDPVTYVEVELVEPTKLGAGTLTGFRFAIPGRGDGTYELVDDTIDALQYELYLVEEGEGWAFHPSYGPGSITVEGDVATVTLTVGSVGSDELIHLRATVHLTAPSP
jgi:hypothetical protein